MNIIRKRISSLQNKPIITGAFFLTASGIICRLLGFLYRIFLSNTIGAKELGIFQLVMPVFILGVSVCSGGIQIAVSRFVAENIKNKDECINIFKAGIVLCLFLSILSCGFIFLFSNQIATYCIGSDKCASLIRLLCLAIPMAAFHSCVFGYYFGISRAGIPAVAEIVEQLSKMIAFGIVFYVFGNNFCANKAVVAVISLVLSEFVNTLFLCHMIIKECRCISTDDTTSNNSFKNSLKNSIAKIFKVSYILTLNKVMLNTFQSVEAFLFPIMLFKYGLSKSEAIEMYGVFSGMALPIVMFPSSVITSVSLLLMPKIARDNSGQKKSSLNKTTQSVTTATAFCGIMCTLFFFLLGNPIGHFLFKNSIAGSYIVTLSWLCPFLYLSITLGSILHGLGKTTEAFLHNMASVIIRICFLVFVVPQTGITGYYWGTLLSYIVITLLHYNGVRKEIQ
jgi:stage V sporulation protein B